MLGLSFIGEQAIKTIHLVDPSKDVIQSLVKKVNDSYITMKDFIFIHHSKGQDLILSPDSKTVFIAGMGGKEIKEILESLSSQFTDKDRIVISPHRKILDLREYLAGSEYRLVEEVVIWEEDQFYQVLNLIKDSSYPAVTLYGDKLWNGETGKNYRHHQLKAFRSHQNSQARAFIAYLEGLSP